MDDELQEKAHRARRQKLAMSDFSAEIRVYLPPQEFDNYAIAIGMPVVLPQSKSGLAQFHMHNAVFLRNPNSNVR
ncbi:MAG: hypothetical protein ACRCVX_08705 [Shewanella sp.]